jgi:hypothetical protein
MSSNSISSDSLELETALRDLAPVSLNEDFFSRLEAAVDGSLLALSPAEIHFESSLRRHAPVALSADFMSQLESVVAGVQFAVDDKIVLFPKTAPVIAKPAAKTRYSMWAAAAAVALIGAATALFMPGQNAVSGFVARSGGVDHSAVVNPTPLDSHYAPAGFNRGLDDAIDEGVTWHQADAPHRVLKVQYMDKTTLKNAEGKTVEVVQPSTEYILVPEKMD